MWYQGCRSCKNRTGKDHQDTDRCPECLAKIKKRKNPDSKKTQGKNQKGHVEQTNDRSSRSGPTHNYAESSDDPSMDEDSEEESGKDSGDMQQGSLFISGDPSWDGRRRDRHSQPLGTEEGHYTPTDHRRSKDMDDISPDRIPT